MRFGRSNKPTYSLFFATDLHGSEKCFGKFLNAASFYGVDALVLGGDLTGKVMVPVVLRDDGSHEAEFLDTPAIARTHDELAALEKRIRFNGHYPYRCDADEFRRLREDRPYRDQVFNQVIRAEVERWVARADERLNGTPCIAIPGNDDEDFVGEVLSTGERLTNAEGRIVELGPFQVLSFGYSNPTPWNSPRELEEDELLERLEALARELDPERPAVFNVHPPPYNSGLDLAPEIDENFKLVGGGTSRLVPVGSRAVATVIERVQPLLTLHGHVHDSRGSTTIGRTVCLNPGSEYNVGVLRGAIVRLTEDKVLGHQFVAA
jgi:Icc-related predicted phosphoesterase